MRLVLLGSCVAIASFSPAVAGPDFVGDTAPSKKFAASDARREILPSDDVLFAHDSAALDPLGAQQIDTAARWLARHPGYRMVLEGHADSSGAVEYNEDLAMRRAQSVRDRLTDDGIAIGRVVLVVFGEAGAKPIPAAFDRRVAVYATAQPIPAIVATSLHDRAAYAVTWIENGALFMETRAREPEPAVVTARR